MGEKKNLSPRERHVAEIKRLEDAYEKTKSNMLKRDYGKAISRMRKELDEYDAYRLSTMALKAVR